MATKSIRKQQQSAKNKKQQQGSTARGSKSKHRQASEASEFEVESIVGEKRVKRNGRFTINYHVKWVGYAEKTWEPLDNLQNCLDKIEAFKANGHGKKKSSESVIDDSVPDVPLDANDSKGEEDETKEDAALSEQASPDVQDVWDFGFECDEEEEATAPSSAIESSCVGIAMPAARRTRHKSERTTGYLVSDVSGDDDDGDDADCDEDGADEVVVVEETKQIDSDEDDCDETVYTAIAGPHYKLREAALRELSTQFVPAYYGEDMAKSGEDILPFLGGPRVSDAGVAAAKAMEPIDLFFFFLPKTMWRHVAKETNRYERQTRTERTGAARHRLQRRYPPDVAASKFVDAQRKLNMFEEVKPHEILIVLGLLIARSMCPMKFGIENHWSSTQPGAIPVGTWSRFMSRQRFRDIFRFLHFSDNQNPMAKKDRAWKIRPVVETMQRTFAQGLTLGRWIAFDEMVIPSRSSRNAIRIYLKNKPHKYGTKLFAVCCGETNYCARIEVYCGSRQDSRYIDSLSGPAAVIRNLKAIWPTRSIDRSQRRVVVTDREYTCVSLALRLNEMGFSSIGTVTKARLGFPEELKYKFKSVPKALLSQRGLTRLMRCGNAKDLYACSWIDNKPVYFLAYGVSTRKTSVGRKNKNGVTVQVECPEFVAMYNRYMNGVDAHDQLRLQRYSVQRALRAKKYYMTLFFGLLDMALVNAYIVHVEYCKSVNEKPKSHAQFRMVLHEQLLRLSDVDFQHEPSPSPSPSSSGTPRPMSSTVTNHTLKFADDKQPSGKVRYRVCKVCSLLHSRDENKPIGRSKAYCAECSSEKCRVYLCDRIRSTSDNNHMTCFQIWHQLWKNGTDRQGEKGERRIRMRTSRHDDTIDVEEFASYGTGMPSTASNASYASTVY